MCIYLDIETSRDRKITAIGFYEVSTGLVQLVQPNISCEQLFSSLPLQGRLFTFWGTNFDLPIIKEEFQVSLKDYFDTVDLYYLCQKAGLRGGQKAIERRLKIKRSLHGISGSNAFLLWEKYLTGDAESLRKLLLYNREDIIGMIKIHAELRRLHFI